MKFMRKPIKYYFVKEIYWAYFWIPLIGLSIAFFIIGSRLKAEINMCKIYYSEMNTWDCYWAPKVLPQRSSMK